MSENNIQVDQCQNDATTNGDRHHESVEPCACCRALATKYVAFVPAGTVPAGITYYHEPPHTHARPAKAARAVFQFPNVSNLFKGTNGKHKNGNGYRSKPGIEEKPGTDHGEIEEDGATDPSTSDTHHESDGDASVPTASSEDVDHPIDEELLKVPKKKRIFTGLDGVAVLLLGVGLPAFMLVTTVMSCPKRLTLVILNHPLESLAELLLLVSIPLVNLSVWRSLCKNDIRFSISRGIALGGAAGSSLFIALTCVAALFWGRQDLESEIGSSFSNGFCWLSILALTASATSAYLIHRFRKTRELPNARKWILSLTACGALLSLVTFVAAEWRPWTIRLAEEKAVSNSAKERQSGLDQLRLLDPERELRMECSDPRAAGLSGLFLPLKPSAQQELYFAVTGKPYSSRDANNEDFSEMSDEYLSHNVVGDKVKGLSLTRSSLTAEVHPKTLSSRVHWTFVFKNENANRLEARAEIAVPPGAVVTGLTRWKDGEPEEAQFTASGKIAGASMQQMGHDTSAMITDLGRGRVLLHCYPVEPAQQLKVDVTMAAAMKPDGKTTATLIMPKFLATNFSTEGDHVLRLQSQLPLASSTAGLKQDTTPAKDHLLIGKLSEKQLEGAPITVSASRPIDAPKLVMFDKVAVTMKREEALRKEAERQRKLRESERANPEQVVVMIDGSKGLQSLESVRTAINSHTHHVIKAKVVVVKPQYVVQTVEQVSSAAPKHLVVVVDGSASMAAHVKELKAALARIPSTVPVSIIIASQEQSKLSDPMSLNEGLKNLDQMSFKGGQDNLQAVVQGAEIAGETDGGALLWIHGPQPTLNSNIYIMKQYVTAPRFYEVALDSGEVDTYEFFKNHSEIGPFETVTQDKSLVAQLGSFFSKWAPGNSAYSAGFAETDALPGVLPLVSNNVLPETTHQIGSHRIRAAMFSQTERVSGKELLLSDSDASELLQLHAHQEVLSLIKSRHANKAAAIALRYGILSPVTSAVLQTETIPQEEPASEAESNSSNYAVQAGTFAPKLQGATNGTIGPVGADGVVITGVNTAGTVRVNNLANLEALLNIIANLAEIGGGLVGLVILIHGVSIRENASLFGLPVELSPGVRIAIGIAAIVLALAFPATLNWFVASARDANLFS